MVDLQNVMGSGCPESLHLGSQVSAQTPKSLIHPTPYCKPPAAVDKGFAPK
jgi:hypothetical protein